MPIRLIEELTSRKQEKIAMFLTFESVVAVLIGFLPLFLISGGWSNLVRIPVCAGGAALGYLLTVEIQGLPLYEQLLWRGRGWLRLRLQGDRIRPEDLPHTVWEDRPDPFLQVDGPVAIAERAWAEERASATVALPPLRPAGPTGGLPVDSTQISPPPDPHHDAPPDGISAGTTPGAPPSAQHHDAPMGDVPVDPTRDSPPAAAPAEGAEGAPNADL